MNVYKKLAVIIVLLSSFGTGYAQFQDKAYIEDVKKWYPDIDPHLLRSASPVMNKGFMSRYSAYGEGVNAGKASSKKINVEGFDNAIEIETHDVFYNDWDVEIGSPIDNTILQHDVVYISFWIRCLGARNESNTGYARVYLQQNGPPWLKSVDVSIAAGSEWAQYRIPFHAQFQHYKSKEAAVAIALGYSHQTIQVADMRVTNMGDGSNFQASDYPGTKFTYESRAKDAPWRVKAQERIEKFRKGDLEVVVKDKKGNVIPNAEVHVAMQNHEFGFGNIISHTDFSNPGPDGIMYRKIIKENFNEMTPENALKYNTWTQFKSEGVIDKHVFKLLDSMDAYNIRTRGHALVWPSTKYTSVDQYIDKPEVLRKVLRDHITEIGSAVKGRVIDWDVVNEPYINHQFMDILGKEEFLEWFKLAQKADPKAKLFINETRDIVDKGTNMVVMENLFNWVRYLQQNDVQIDGVGFQGHFNETGLTEMDKIYEYFEMFAKLGVQIKITELDIQTKDDELQADYLRDLYTISFSHPSVRAVISWGFWEKSHWRPECAWYRKDWSIKPVGEMHKQLVYKEWWTDEKMKTTEKGVAKTRAFCGDYKVSVTNSKGKLIEKQVKLTNQGERIEIIVD